MTEEDKIIEKNLFTEKASPKSEEEVIEEIVSSHVVLTRGDSSAIWARKLCISVAKESLAKGKEIGILTAASQMTKPLEKTNRYDPLFVDVEDINLDKLGFTATVTTNQATSYIQSYLKRNYNISVNSPVDQYLHYFASDIATEAYDKGIKDQASKIAEYEEANSDYIRLNSENLKIIVSLKSKIAELEQIKLGLEKGVSDCINENLNLKEERKQLAEELQSCIVADNIRRCKLDKLDSIIKRLKGEK